jgi:hypothetical protein
LLVRILGVAVVAGLATAGWQVIGSPASHHTPSSTASVTGSPAAPDALAATSALPETIPAADADSVLMGRESGVRLLAHGFVSGYGSGSEARTAPRGLRLLAFRTQAIAGDSGASPPVLSIRIGSQTRGPLVNTSDYLVAAVPPDETSVDLVLTDGGVTQSLSLLTGRPSASNPDICRRVHRVAVVNATRAVTVQVRSASGTVGITSGTITLKSVALSYWADDGSHPASTVSALLHVDATVSLAGDAKAYGADADLIRLLLPGAAPTSAGLAARNAAANRSTQVDDVIEVPADLTTATLLYTGSMTTAKGSLTVQTPVQFGFTIPAG